MWCPGQLGLGRAYVSGDIDIEDDAVAASTEGRTRVWRLDMAACALAFQGGAMGVDQVLAVKPGDEQRPLRRTDRV